MGTIEIKIVVNGPLYVGGEAAPRNVMPFARDARGRPSIPAAMLKGLHRATTEQVAFALGFTVCRAPFADQMCHPLAGERGCVVCRVFGSAWLPGKLFYRDLLIAAAPITETHVVAPQSRRRRVKVAQYSTSRQIVPGPATLTGRIDHQLHDPALLGLALAGLRAITALGASSATGYGQCVVEARAVDVLMRPVDESVLAGALRQLPKGQP